MTMFLGIDLWNPHAGLAVWAALATAFLLGMVHGITPDEHTWPITFSYAVGGYSSRAGMRNALVFSAAFTLQRTLASELAYLALARWLSVGSTGNYVIYLIVGLAMVWAAVYIKRGRLPWHLDLHLHRLKNMEASKEPMSSMHLHIHPHGGVAVGKAPHWSADPCQECKEPELVDPKPWMPALHGFIAGWGFGAFAAIVYTVLAPAMPSAALGWLPGLLFGLGTTLVQVIVGGLVGWIVRRKGGDEQSARRLGLWVAARTLGIGGLAFVAGGLFGLTFPSIANMAISTGIHVHNLDQIGLPLILVVVSVAGVGVSSLVSGLRRISPQSSGADAGHDQPLGNQTPTPPRHKATLSGTGGTRS